MKKILIGSLAIILLAGCQDKKDNKNNFTIIDDTEVCAQALEKIYKDDNYTYYLNCIKSDNIKIKFEDGKTYKLKEVLENNIISIDELIKNGLSVYKKEN